MRLLFETKDRPLYGSAVPMRLGPLADEDVAAYVAARFDSTGRAVGEALNPLLLTGRGHPQRTMLLAHRLWEEVEAGAEASLDDWDAARAAAMNELEPEFDAQWRGLRLLEIVERAGGTAGSQVRVRSFEAMGPFNKSVIFGPQLAMALLATHLNGQRLSIDHGYPLRLVTPNRSCVLSIKWLVSIEVLT